MATQVTIESPAKAKTYFEAKMAFTTGPVELERITPEDIEWVAARRMKVRGSKTNAGELLRKMRDEEWR